MSGGYNLELKSGNLRLWRIFGNAWKAGRKLTCGKRSNQISAGPLPYIQARLGIIDDPKKDMPRTNMGPGCLVILRMRIS